MILINGSGGGIFVLSHFFAGFGLVCQTDLANPARLHAESFGAIVLKNSSVKVAGPGRLKNLFGPVCLPEAGKPG